MNESYLENTILDSPYADHHSPITKEESSSNLLRRASSVIKLKPIDQTIGSTY